MTVDSYAVGADFFDLYGIPLLAGRRFTATDTDRDVIVGERLSRVLWPGHNPVGRTFIFDDVRYQVVGLAREIAMPSLDGARNDLPEFYTPFRPGGSYVALSVKCTTACPTVPELQRRLSATAAGVRTLRPEIPDVVFQKELERPRSAALLGGLFAVIAVLTAAGGLFSVLSFGVNRRKRELGIRAALGASAASIRRLVLLDGARTAALGLVIGGTASWFLARALASLQYGVSRRDPETWLAVVGIIALTTFAACWLPARRAGEADVAGLMRDG